MPLQRVADTQFGSSIMMLGIPALIVGGFLQLNWEGGFPHLSIDRNRTAEIEQAARNEFGKIGNAGTIRQWERSAVERWNASQGQQNPYASSSYPNNSAYPSSQPDASTPYTWQTPSQQQPIPSSSAAKYVSTQTQRNVPTSAYPNSSTYYQQNSSQQQVPQQSYYPQQQSNQQQQPNQQQQSYHPPQLYPQQNYQPQQQPTYQQPQPYSQLPTYQPPQAQSYQSQNFGPWRQ